jgi:hypothetical protein
MNMEVYCDSVCFSRWIALFRSNMLPPSSDYHEDEGSRFSWNISVCIQTARRHMKTILILTALRTWNISYSPCLLEENLELRSKK